MDPAKTARILQEIYGDNAVSVAMRWRDRSRSTGAFWSLVASELERRPEPERLAG